MPRFHTRKNLGVATREAIEDRRISTGSSFLRRAFRWFASWFPTKRLQSRVRGGQPALPLAHPHRGGREGPLIGALRNLLVGGTVAVGALVFPLESAPGDRMPGRPACAAVNLKEWLGTTRSS